MKSGLPIVLSVVLWMLLNSFPAVVSPVVLFAYLILVGTLLWSGVRHRGSEWGCGICFCVLLLAWPVIIALGFRLFCLLAYGDSELQNQ